MKILELFSGTASFSNVAKELGHEVFTIDNDDYHKPDLCIDILDLKPEMIPFKPDIIWASPPCTTFSMLSVGHHWNRDRTPKTEKCVQGLKIANKTIEIIKELKPKYFIIENPRGMLRTMDFMQEFNRTTATYCQYGDSRMKPTDLWNNFNFIAKRCKNGMPCHERVPRGSALGTQGMKNSILRSIVPRELCLEILECIKHEN